MLNFVSGDRIEQLKFLPLHSVLYGIVYLASTLASRSLPLALASKTTGLGLGVENAVRPRTHP